MPSNIFETMTRFFDEASWKYIQVEGKAILQLACRGENGRWMCIAQAKDDLDRMLFFSVLETNVPENRRALVSEFLTRANYGLALGNFEMDFGDGEVRYKTSIDVAGGQLTTGMVATMVRVNLAMMDLYLPGIMSVIYGDTSPADAVARAEA